MPTLRKALQIKAPAYLHDAGSQQGIHGLGEDLMTSLESTRHSQLSPVSWRRLRGSDHGLRLRHAHDEPITMEIQASDELRVKHVYHVTCTDRPAPLDDFRTTQEEFTNQITSINTLIKPKSIGRQHAAQRTASPPDMQSTPGGPIHPPGTSHLHTEDITQRESAGFIHPSSAWAVAVWVER
ncbi:hypothetical protein EYF80_005466 [Liparis tanakae]|uniref:Uncharacterized protein n=1 Tax=Liparis tanakae TaxID=230148 RepID=A0A4Z2J1N9_9TELE|nr:hypothetical protein EYF80_005466 [Liparis tanakae]